MASMACTPRLASRGDLRSVLLQHSEPTQYTTCFEPFSDRTLHLQQKLPWVCIGDFNEILYSFEKQGCHDHGSTRRNYQAQQEGSPVRSKAWLCPVSEGQWPCKVASAREGKGIDDHWRVTLFSSYLLPFFLLFLLKLNHYRLCNAYLKPE